MFRSNVSIALTCLFALASHAAWADDDNNIGALGRIQTHTLILKAKLNEKNARQQLDGAVSADGTPVGPVMAASPVESALPNVKMIVNGNSGLAATFIYAGGITAAGKVGAKIPGGYTIRSMSVADRTVEVMDFKGKVVTLGMSSTAPTVPVAQPSGSSGLQQRFILGGAPVVGGPLTGH
jgi:type IV pilus biogenesis protein PilP